jgi:hypothetical protein
MEENSLLALDLKLALGLEGGTLLYIQLLTVSVSL